MYLKDFVFQVPHKLCYLVLLLGPLSNDYVFVGVGNDNRTLVQTDNKHPLPPNVIAAILTCFS